MSALNSRPGHTTAEVNGPMVGYVQLSRTAGHSIEVRQQLDAAAARIGGRLQRVAYEPPPPATVLWSLIERLDRAASTQVAWELAEIAAADGIDLRRLVATAPTPALWALVADLGRTGGIIVTPSPAHLNSLGKARDRVLHWLSQSQPSVHIVIADHGHQPQPANISRRDNHRWRILCELQSQAFGYAVEVATVTAHMHLSRAGLTDLVAAIDAVLTEIIGAAVDFDLAMVPEQPNQLLVRLLYNHRLLRLEVIETRDHADEPVSDQLTTLCTWPFRGRAYRARTADGKTVTGCELPLPLSEEWR